MSSLPLKTMTKFEETPEGIVDTYPQPKNTAVTSLSFSRYAYCPNRWAWFQSFPIPLFNYSQIVHNVPFVLMSCRWQPFTFISFVLVFIYLVNTGRIQLSSECPIFESDSVTSSLFHQCLLILVEFCICTHNLFFILIFHMTQKALCTFPLVS